METIRLAVAQYSAGSDSRYENYSKVLPLIETAAAAKADIIVLPELSGVKYFPASKNNSEKFLEPENGPTTRNLKNMAKKFKIRIVYSIAEKAKNGNFISGIILNAKGDIAGKYLKNNIPDIEKKVFKPGSGNYPVFKTKAGNLGMILCYDRNFDEAWETLASDGAQIICVMSATPVSKAAGWEKLFRSKAKETGCFTACANRIGAESELKFAGKSLIVSPAGKILKKASSNKTGLIIEDINLKEAGKTK